MKDYKEKKIFEILNERQQGKEPWLVGGERGRGLMFSPSTHTIQPEKRLLTIEKRSYPAWKEIVNNLEEEPLNQKEIVDNWKEEQLNQLTNEVRAPLS